MPAIWKSPLLATFLDGGQNTLIYLWNFERMKKMQKIITSMSMESQGKTEELTHELVEAREQVKTLQDRINRMEMLFLQSAAGVATQTITPEKLRAISTSGGPKLTNSTSNSDLASEGMDSIQDHVPFFDDEVKPPQLEPKQVVEVLNMTKSIAEIVDKTEQLQASRSDRRSDSVRGASVEKQLKRNLSNDLRMLSRDNDKAFALSCQLQKAVEISNTILEDPYTITMGSGGKDSPSPRVRTNTELSHKTESSESRSSSQEVTNPAEVMLHVNAESVSEHLWVGRLFGRIDELVSALAPTKEAVDDRLAVYQYIRGIVSQFLGVEVAPVGSFVSRTFLLEGDLDLTVVMPRNMDTNSWFVRLNEALCLAAMGAQNMKPNDRHNLMRMIVNSVSFINAEVKIVKTTINNIAIDISGNQIGSIYAQALIEKVDAFIAKKHLFKRSMILIKAWCQYEANRFANIPLVGGAVLGARDGRLSSWSLLIMGIWLFNHYGSEITHPLQALLLFLRYYKDFDWINFALTAYGPVSIADLSPIETTESVSYFIPEEVISDTFKRFNVMRRGDPKSEDPSAAKPPSAPVVPAAGEEADDGLFSSEYRRSVMNIIDPVKGNYNVSSSVDLSGYQFIQKAFEGGYMAVLEMIKQCSDCPIPDESLQANAPARNADVPIVKQFLNQTTAELKLAGRGRGLSKAPEDYDPYASSPSEIEGWLAHVEGVFVKTVPRDALCAVVYHILATKGPVPVGEIGKCLQGMTNNNDLMPTIKLEYKGLKKFIEMYPEFYSVGTEHPFNPLVYLNSTGAKPSMVDDIPNVLMTLSPSGYSPSNNSVQDGATTPSSSSSEYTIFEAPKHVFMHASSLPNEGFYRMNSGGSSGPNKMSGGGDGYQFQPLRKGNSFKEHKASNQQQGYDQNRRKGGSFVHMVPNRDDIYVQQHGMPPMMQQQQNVPQRRMYAQQGTNMNYNREPTSMVPVPGAYRMHSQPRLSDSMASTTASSDSAGLDQNGPHVAVSLDNPASHPAQGFGHYHDTVHAPMSPMRVDYSSPPSAASSSAASPPLAMHQVGQVVYYEAAAPQQHQSGGFVPPDYYGGAPPLPPPMHPQPLPMAVGAPVPIPMPIPAPYPSNLTQARPPNSPGHNPGVQYFYSSS